MFLKRRKLDKERGELIEVITGLTHEKRLAGADRDQIERSLTAHMSRLSQLDFELAALDEMLSTADALIDSPVARMARYVARKSIAPQQGRSVRIRHLGHHLLTR